MTFKILHGDCKEKLFDMIAEGIQVDSIITDPPYELGFMNKSWDSTGIANDVELWRLAYRILKPGGHLLSFGGSRTYHRMACAVEDAGFEIRDCISWIYGSGFPKSKNIGNGFGSALKPAHEPIVMARKPLSEKNIASNVMKHGTGGINIDGCRVEGLVPERPNPILGSREGVTYGFGTGKGRNGRMSDGSKGRFPANLIHDGSEEVEAEFARQSKAMGVHSAGKARGAKRSTSTSELFFNKGFSYNLGHRYEEDKYYSASRFFYSAKASAAERNGSKHPTVKPIALMRYLCRLVTPPSGVVLDPFAGTGTTGQAALEEGFGAILIEKESEYIADINKRIDNVQLPLKQLERVLRDK